MADIIRFFGIITGAFAIGALGVFTLAEKGTTALAPPARYWASATGLVVEISGVVSRFVLWGDPLTYRDISFLTVNILMGVTVLVVLKQGPQKEAKHG